MSVTTVDYIFAELILTIELLSTSNHHVNSFLFLPGGPWGSRSREGDAVGVWEAARAPGEECGLAEEEDGQGHRDTPQGHHPCHAGEE